MSKSTGIYWTRAKTRGAYQRDDAQAACSDLDRAGFTDWTLPSYTQFTLTLNELDFRVAPIDNLIDIEFRTFWASETISTNGLIWSSDTGSLFQRTPTSFHQVLCVRK